MFFDTVNLKPSLDRMTAQLSATRDCTARMVSLPSVAGMDPIDQTQRWKRSLRAPLVFRSLNLLLARNVSLLRSGSPV